jgi:thiol-disulfide isomerase/thioredoxin
MKLLLVITILFCQTAFAQSQPVSARFSEKLMNAEFQSLDQSAPIKLSDYKGKLIVLGMWASWCSPCRMAVTTLAELNKDFAARGVAVIGLTIEKPEADEAKVQKFICDFQPNFKLGWMNREFIKDLLGDTGYIPQIYIVKDDGTIIKKFIGYSFDETGARVREAVEQALNNPPARQ